MATIDIELPEKLTKAVQLPKCVDLRLPKPELPSITLPTGGSIKGIADFTKGIPDDCSMSFSIIAQLAPIMASMECLLKLLKVVAPLIKVMEALPGLNPIKIGEAVSEFLKAAADLKDCLLVPTPLMMIPFVKDLLKLIAKLLHCLVQQLESIVAVLGGLAIEISTAQAAGNDDVLATLECAKENAELAAAGVMTSIEPITVLLSLAEPFLGIAGVDPIKLPALASGTDLAAMQETVATLKSVSESLNTLADAL